MTAYDPPKPIVVHPEVGWKGPETVNHDDAGVWWTRAGSRWEMVRVFTEHPRQFIWWTPGWSMTVATEHDMNRASAYALAIGCAERMKILESAWSLCKNDK